MEKSDMVFLYHPHPYDMDPEAQLGLGLLLLASYAEKLGAKIRVINKQSEDLSKLWVPRCKYLMLYGCLIDKPILDRISMRAIINGEADRVFIGGPIANSAHTDGYCTVISGYGEDFIEMLLSPSLNSVNTEKLSHNINYYPFPNRILIEGNYGGNIFKNKRCEVSTTLLTSRGCKYRCAFCESGNDKFFQEYSLERVERELEDCLSLGIKNIRISDDNLVSNRKRLEDLCRLFKDAGVKWRGSIRTVPNSVEMYEMMVDSGCEELSFGVESGDQNVLDLLNKGTTVESNTKAIRNANKAGVGVTRALMMMGTPGETFETLEKNISWVEQACPDIVSLKIFVPYPGTDVYNNPEKYKCKLHLPIANPNNSAYRPSGTDPIANIDSEELYDIELTNQFKFMKVYLEGKGIENRG